VPADSLRVRRILTFIVPFAVLLTLAGTAAADHIIGTACNRTQKCADHDGWPRMTLADVQIASPTGSTLRGREQRVNELLGWHGSDTLYGGERADVLWADHIGVGQPTDQVDVIYGYGGTDFIYSGHGRNTIYGGAGNDAIKVRYGRGLVDCGPGRDVINLPRGRQSRWTVRNCEKIDRLTEQARGGGLQPLP
jgi:Ca2+-binding RTX toxin-like protein